jgi:hypothetical protein
MFVNLYKMLREEDLLKKKIVADWSGQEVLQKYDPEKALWLCAKLNSIKFWQIGYVGYFAWFRNAVKTFCKSGLFEQAMTFCVMVNTIILALDRYGIDESEDQLLKNFNLFFTIVFCCELGFKLFGLGFKRTKLCFFLFLFF